MKREFLQNFKVGDQPLPKEIIDAIMAENGKDIESAKKPFADYDTIKDQLATAQETIKGFEIQDIEGVRKSAKEWEDKYNQAIADHNAKLADMEFDGDLKDAIEAAKGKSVKAIRAMLDIEAKSQQKPCCGHQGRAGEPAEGLWLPVWRRTERSPPTMGKPVPAEIFPAPVISTSALPA